MSPSKSFVVFCFLGVGVLGIAFLGGGLDLDLKFLRGAAVQAVDTVNPPDDPEELGIISTGEIGETVSKGLTLEEEEALKAAALEFIKQKSETYKWDAKPGTLVGEKVLAVDSEAGIYQVQIEFISMSTGYGNRQEKVVQTMETPHQGVITFEKGVVVDGVLDDRWDITAQKSTLY